jgi:hypothetical protein
LPSLPYASSSQEFRACYGQLGSFSEPVSPFVLAGRRLA